MSVCILCAYEYVYVRLKALLTRKIFIKNVCECAPLLLHVVHTHTRRQCDTYLFIEFGFISVAFVDASSLVVENFMKNDGDFLY